MKRIILSTLIFILISTFFMGNLYAKKTWLALGQDFKAEEVTLYNGNSIFADDNTIVQCRWSVKNLRQNGDLKIATFIDGKQEDIQTVHLSDNYIGKNTGGTNNYHWKAIAGQHKFTCKVDSDDHFNEKNEANNRTSLIKTIPTRWPSAVAPGTKLPDLFVKSLNYKLHNNNYTELEVTIGNKGTADYDGTMCTVEIIIVNVDTGKKIKADASLSTRLSSGQQTVVAQGYSNVAGTWNIDIHVDQKSKIKELDETNNKFSKNNYIIPSLWPSAR